MEPARPAVARWRAAAGGGASRPL